MNDSRAIATTLAGAVVGGVATYLWFTDHGRHVRRQIGPTFENMAKELLSFRTTALKVIGVASEVWALLNDARGEIERPPRYRGRQTSPF